MRWIDAIDRLNAFVGKAAGWLIVVLTLAVSYEVFVRYVLSAPTTWAYDVSYMLYGALFMLAGAYTLSRNGHVRGDFIYRMLKPRTQAWLDLALYVLFFFPGITALIYSGYGFAELSWMMHEHSSSSPNGPPLYHFKTLVPITGALLFLQGLAEVGRCVVCIRNGAWPRRIHDVQETEQEILAARGAGDEGAKL